MGSEPVGDLCILRDDTADAWIVTICRGGGRREALSQFDTREAAAEFAVEERDRRTSEGEPPLAVHFPDDCPCYHDPPDPKRAR